MEELKVYELDYTNLEGLEVTFYHYRKMFGILIRFFRRDKSTVIPEKWGGATICQLKDLSSGKSYYGATICSNKDTYNFQKARDYSFNRAYRNYLAFNSRDFHFYENIIYKKRVDLVRDA